MTLNWNVPNEKYYSNGLSKVILYPGDSAPNAETGVAWEGVITIDETPTGGDYNKLWANNQEYTQLVSDQKMEGKIECYQYPELFNKALGVVTHNGFKFDAQGRTPVHLFYQTLLHSEGGGENVDFKFTWLYNLMVKPNDVNNQTVNESPEAITFSFDFETRKLPVQSPANTLPTSKIGIDTRYVDPVTRADLLAHLDDLVFVDGAFLDPGGVLALALVGSDP